MAKAPTSRSGNLLRGNAPSDVARERCVSYPPSDEDPGTGALNLHPHLRRQTSPSLGIMWVVMLWSRVEFSRVASVAVTTPSGSSGIDLEHMEHAVDPSRCATNVPQGYCLVAVQADQKGGSRPLTCANTAWRHRGRTDDLRIENEQAAYRLTMCHKMCHLAPLRGGSVGLESRS